MTGAGCGATLASQPYLPPVSAAWAGTAWGGAPVSSAFTLAVTWAAPTGVLNPTGLATDHPAAGPTGPQPCGTCFPTTRSSNSRTYGIGGAYCPSGNLLSDGVCNVELLMSVAIKFVDIVEDRSWGEVKNLFR